MLTLLGRLYYVQELDPSKPVQTAGRLHNAAIVLPAARGQIVDSLGQPLVTNRATYVVTVDRSQLLAQKDQGRAVLTRLAAVLHTSRADLTQRVTPCGVKVPAPCWTGQPYQPVPVATDPGQDVLLHIKERSDLFPGIAVATQSVRSYPDQTLAAHELGYVGDVTAADEKADPALRDDDSIGRAGLEESYDADLRGTDGSRTVGLDARGEAVRSGKVVPAVAGNTVVTSIDASVQKLAETSLRTQILATRKRGLPAPAGAVVVMDPATGRIIASASYPTYDPQVFAGGISVADYRKLTDPSAGQPLLSRAIDGQYAPGSTFKLISSSSDVMTKEATLTGRYGCPSSLNVDGRTKTNYDSESLPGPINLATALQFSCDTWFYRFAVSEYRADQKRIAQGKQPHEYLQHMARAFGVGSEPGVDLPAGEQASGSVADRAGRLARWKANRAQYCADAKSGYPDEKNRSVRAYLTKLASENCTDGWRYRAGDNADLAIGQGETTASPLQLAAAYSAMVNGGTLYKPTFGWAVEDARGNIVRTITAQVKNKVPVDSSVLKYFRTALRFTGSHYVSGKVGFAGSPIISQISGKTGTAEVYGKKDTSWFASWGPGAKPAFVVVTMIEQGGTGGSAAAPAARRIWEGLLGVKGSPVLAGSQPATTVPHVVAADVAMPATTATPSASPSPRASASASTSRSRVPSTPSLPSPSPSLPPDLRSGRPSTGAKTPAVRTSTRSRP